MGYAPDSVRWRFRQLRTLSRWLHDHHLEAKDLDAAWVDGLVANRRAQGRTTLVAVVNLSLLLAYLRNVGPETEVPSRGLLPARQQRVAPYLYSDADIAALITAARSLNPPLRAATYETFIGLLSVAGLRLGEALDLDRDDVKKGRLLLIVRHAKRGGRKVPLHEWTVRAQRGYFDCVDRHFPDTLSPPVFVSTRGTRMNKDSMQATFPVLIDRAGLTGQGQPTPPQNS